MKDTPDDVIFELLQKEAFADTELGRSILGSAENINSFQRKTLLILLIIIILQKNSLCAAGNLKHKDLCKVPHPCKILKS